MAQGLIYTISEIDDDSSTISLIKVTDPARPAIIATSLLPINPVTLCVIAGNIWLADTWQGLYRLAISSGGKIDLALAHEIEDGCWGIARQLPLLALAAGERGLQLVDIADPQQPRHIATYNDPMLNTGHVAIIGQRAILAGRPARVVGISDPTQPQLMGMQQWGIFHSALGRDLGIRIRPQGIDLIQVDQATL